MTMSSKKLGYQLCERQEARERNMSFLLVHIFVENGFQKRKIGPKLNKNIRRSAAIFTDLSIGPSAVVIGVSPCAITALLITNQRRNGSFSVGIDQIIKREFLVESWPCFDKKRLIFYEDMIL